LVVCANRNHIFTPTSYLLIDKVKLKRKNNANPNISFIRSLR